MMAYACHRAGAIILLVGVWQMIGYAQSPPDTSAPVEETETALESLLENDEREEDASEILDETLWLKDHPLDLNTASVAELAAIPRLSIEEAAEIILLRKRLKRFDAVEQLALIPNVGDDILNKARSYVIVRAHDSDDAFSLRLTTRAIRDLQQRKGFLEGSFAGSPIKSYNRLTLTHQRQVESGVLFEKDAGERTPDGFVSGYLAVHDVGFISTAILGDYVVEAGQGIVLWRPMALQKGSEAVRAAQRSPRGISPYRSSDEFHFLRGAAVTTSFSVADHAMSLTGFYSRRSLSATLSGDSVSTFDEAGLFRTQSERKRMHTVVERLVGGRLMWHSSESWAIGSTLYHATFDKPIRGDGVAAFSGTRALAVSADAEVRVGEFGSAFPTVSLFGELAHAVGMAGIAGAALTFQRKGAVALAYRSYSPRYNGLHANGFGERSTTNNETGFFFAAAIRPAARIRFSGYVDHFRFPWRSASVPLPASGRDIFLQMDLSPTRTLDLSVRLTHKQQETSETLRDALGRESTVLTDLLQRKIRLTGVLQASPYLRLKARVEFVHVEFSASGKREQGLVLYQDAGFRPVNTFSAEARLIFFHTHSYDSRVYEYESDLRGVLTNIALYGRGVRWYLLVRWLPAPWFGVSVKYAETRKDGVNSIGSGLTEIAGDTDNRLSAQLEVKF